MTSPSELKFLGFMHGNYWEMFPGIVDQSQFSRRSLRTDAIL